MNQNENPMFPWDSSILPTAVPPFRETVTDSFLWCRRKEEAVQRTQPPLFFFVFLYFLISYPQYCMTSSQNIAFAQENHSLV